MMQRIVLISLICLLVIGCRSRKKIITKKSDQPIEVANKIEPIKEEFKSEDETIVVNPVINNTTQYIDVYKNIAMKEMQSYGIPASITLAQGILESGSGKGRLAVKANNHFGIKCHGWAGKKIYHDDDEKQECFRKYKSAETSFRDHSLFLANRKRYSKLFDLKTSDYKNWAKELRKAGYATDRKYPQKLISLIERYKLYEYDKQVLGEDYKLIKSKPEVVVEHVVVKGDTLYSISKKYGLTISEIQKLNKLSSNSISIGQKLKITSN